MIQASEKLTAAIINEAPQRIIIELGDMLLSNEDLSASAGMEYVEESNADTDLSIGNAIANTISFTLLNVAGQYNNIVLAGKTLSAYLGAKSDSGLVTQATFFTGRGCIAVTEISSSTQLLFNIITASQARPYLKMNGKAVNDQPAYPVYALLLRDNILTAMSILAEMSRLAALPAMIVTRQQKHMLTHIAEAASRGIGIKTTQWRLTTLRTVQAHTWGMKRYTMERRLPRLQAAHTASCCPLLLRSLREMRIE